MKHLILTLNKLNPLFVASCFASICEKLGSIGFDLKNLQYGKDSLCIYINFYPTINDNPQEPRWKEVVFGFCHDSVDSHLRRNGGKAYDASYSEAVDNFIADAQKVYDEKSSRRETIDGVECSYVNGKLTLDASKLLADVERLANKRLSNGLFGK